MSDVAPNQDVLAALAALPDDAPLVMLNLLKFKPHGGVEAYARYGVAVMPLIEARGGRVIYAGRCDLPLVSSESWDSIALVEYPSRRAFVEMITSAEYAAVSGDREAGLERTVLYATTPRAPGPQ